MSIRPDFGPGYDEELWEPEPYSLTEDEDLAEREARRSESSSTSTRNPTKRSDRP